MVDTAVCQQSEFQPMTNWLHSVGRVVFSLVNRFFTARRCANAVRAVAMCLSACPSHVRVYQNG